MSYFSKEIYEKKKSYAYRVSGEAIDIIKETLKEKGIEIDEEVLENLQSLSHLRHSIHSNERFYSSYEGLPFDLIDELISSIKSGFSKVLSEETLNKLKTSDSIQLESINEDNYLLAEALDVSTEYFEENYDCCIDQIRRINADQIDNWSTKIRSFFKDINDLFGTDFPD